MVSIVIGLCDATEIYMHVDYDTYPVSFHEELYFCVGILTRIRVLKSISMKFIKKITEQVLVNTHLGALASKTCISHLKLYI